VRQIGSDEQVRVRNFQETLRTDESVIYQQFVMVPPGVYFVMAMVRDRNGPAYARAERADTAPRFAGPALTEPIAVYTAEAAPSVVPSRSWSPTHGRRCRTVPTPCGSMWSATGRSPVRLSRASSTMPITSSGAIPWRSPAVPMWHRPRLSSSRRTSRWAGPAPNADGWGPGYDHTRFLVSFSNQWVITNFDEMMSLLRYFARQDWVDSLRRAPPDRRPDVWRQFWKATDPCR